MKCSLVTLLTMVTLGILAGCVGETYYKLEHPESGLYAEVRNSKDYESFSLEITKHPDGTVTGKLEETGVSASDPLRAAQDANTALLDKLISVLPVN